MPREHNMKTYCVFIFTFFLLSSCQEGAFYEKNTAILNRSWEYGDIKEFPVYIEDKNAVYAVYVNLRNTDKYDFSNVFLRIHESGPAIADTAKRIELKLAELDGRWTGNDAGHLYEHQVLYKENYSFPDTGIYTFGIEQNMRENPLHDISDVGIKLVKK